MEFDDMFIHTVQLRPYLGAGSLGDQYGPPATVPALVDPSEVLYRTADGREKRARAAVYLPITVTPTPTLQAEVTGQSPGVHGHIAALTEWRDTTGTFPECWQAVIDS